MGNRHTEPTIGPEPVPVSNYCHINECNKIKYKESKYCKKHKCKVRSCNGRKIKGKKYCKKHKCSLCNERTHIYYSHNKTKRNKYCEEHKCVNYCGNKKLKYFDFCGYCKCKIKNCNHKKIKGKNYCKIHKCNIKKCPNQIITKYNEYLNPDIPLSPNECKYCSIHKCSMLGCNNERDNSLLCVICKNRMNKRFNFKSL